MFTCASIDNRRPSQLLTIYYGILRITLNSCALIFGKEIVKILLFAMTIAKYARLLITTQIMILAA